MKDVELEDVALKALQEGLIHLQKAQIARLNDVNNTNVPIRHKDVVDANKLLHVLVRYTFLRSPRKENNG